MESKRGRFITIEGIEGVGKSTALKFLESHLSRHHIPIRVTREPGGTPVSEDIRQVLLGHYDEVMGPDTELLLMFAGRAQNIAEVILPSLQRGQWVVSDRFTDASFAYQGGGRGVNRRHIFELAQWVQGDLQPDLTILLDAPVKIGLERVESRGAKDRIEIEGVDFFERVRQSYLNLASAEPERFFVIDATQSLTDIQQQLIKAVNPLMGSL